MANFLINSPGLSTTGTDNAELFLVQSAAVSATTIVAKGGNDTIQLLEGVASADKVSVATEGGADFIQISSTLFDERSVFRGGAGGDTINLKAGGIQGEVLLGAGSDQLIVTAAAELATVGFGAGADLFTAAVALSAAKGVFSMGSGADTVDLDEGIFTEAAINGGGGADTFTLSANGATNTALTVKGGAGGDTITFDLDADDTQILGGNGSDKIVQTQGGAAKSLNESAQVLGGSGSDTITILDISAAASAAIGGGAGKDFITLDKAALSGSVSVIGGGGADSISLGAYVVGAESTVIGGGGADSITFSSEISSSTKLATQIGIQAFSDSTLSATDVVTFAQTGLSQAAESGGTTLDFATDGLGTNLSLGVGVSTEVVVASGIVTNFTSTLSDLTARVAALDATVTTKGSVVAFMEEAGGTGEGDGQANGSAAYLFIQGGATDTIVELQGGGTLSGFAASNGLVVTNSAASVNFKGY